MKDISLFISLYYLIATVLCQEYRDEDYSARSEYDESFEPKFLATSQSFSVEIGDEITLPCDVDKADTAYPLMFKYISLEGKDRMIYVGDQPVGKNRRIRKEGNSFIINSVKKSDAGQYVCRFESSPVVQLLHNLNVQYPAQVRRVSDEIQSVTKGSSVPLECDALGNPPPAITWSKKEGHMPSGEQSEEGRSITLENVDRHMEGTYICTAANGIGEPSSTSLTVHVDYEPEIITEQAIINTADGYEAELVCIVHGRPSPKVVWLREDSLVSSDRHIMTHDGRHRHTLTIKNVVEEDFGKYSCKAVNTYGETAKTLDLTGLPKQPKITSSPAGGEKSSYTLTWKTETFSPIMQYRLKYRKITDNRQRRGPGAWVDSLFSPVKTSVRDTQFNHGVIDMAHPLEELEPAEDYEATVQVENKFGWSAESNVFKFNTRKEMAVGQSASDGHKLHTGLSYSVAAMLFLVTFL